MWTLLPMSTITMLSPHCVRLFRASLYSVQMFKHTNNDSLLSWGTEDRYMLRLFKVTESKISWMKVRNIFRPKLTHRPLHLHMSGCQTYANGFRSDEERQSTPKVHFTKLEQSQWAFQLSDKELYVGLICHSCIPYRKLWLRQLKHHNLQTARNMRILQNRGPHLSTSLYTGCPRRNGQNFGRVFLMLKYTDITQNTYIQS